MEYSKNFNFALPSSSNDVDLADINEIANNFRKVDENAVKKEQGKGLSTNDFTNEQKEKVSKSLTSEDIDQAYNPTSEKAQSGVAVSEVLNKGFDFILNSDNFLPPYSEVGYYNTSLEKVTASGYMRTPKPIELVPYGAGYDYIYLTANFETTNASDRINILFIDENDNYVSLIGYSPSTSNYGSVAVPSNAKSFVAYCRDTSGLGIDMSNFCVSYTAKIYEEYDEKAIVKSEAMNMKVIEDVVNEAVGEIVINSPFANKSVVNFGDSIFGNYQDTEGKNKSISSMIADLTGATVYNCSFGGCKMAYYTGNTQQLFTMPKLADAITSGDYSLQEEAMLNWTDATDMQKQSFATLKSIDFANVDIITIAYGTNDYSVGIDLDRENKKKDIYTFGGALRYSIEKILSTYPHIKIYVCTPVFRYWITDGVYSDSDTVENADGNLLTDFVEKEKSIANEYHIPCVDNYFDLGLNKFTKSVYFNEPDTTHPNVDGRYLIAKNIVNALLYGATSQYANIGDIETALDSIIAIQESLIGGAEQ